MLRRKEDTRDSADKAGAPPTTPLAPILNFQFHCTRIRLGYTSFDKIFAAAVVQLARKPTKIPRLLLMSSSIDLAKSCDMITINRRTNNQTPGYYPLLAWKCMIYTCTTSTYNNRSWKFTLRLGNQNLPFRRAGGGCC